MEFVGQCKEGHRTVLTANYLMSLLLVVRFCSVKYKISVFNYVQLMGEPFKVSAWCNTGVYRSAHSYTKRGYGKKHCGRKELKGQIVVTSLERGFVVFVWVGAVWRGSEAHPEPSVGALCPLPAWAALQRRNAALHCKLGDLGKHQCGHWAD